MAGNTLEQKEHRMTHSTFYLYGILPNELEGMEYFDALEFKKKHCIDLYRRLYHMKRDNAADVQLHYVLKALNHTEALISERYAV